MKREELAAIIGRNITRLRKIKNMTQNELADRLQYSYKSVSKWEQGDGIPDVYILVQLAEIFDVTIEELIEGTAEKEILPRETKQRNRILTLLCSSGLCWLVAVACFVLMGLFGKDLPYSWLAFVFAVPATAIVVLVFSCIWHWKWVRIASISVLVWTSIACVYLVALAAGAGGNLWLLFLIGIPLQILALFFFVWRRGAHTPKN